MLVFQIFSITFLVLLAISLNETKKSTEKPEWAKKNIRDFSDADMERLLDQWEEDDDPLEEDELPEHLRPPPKIDMTKMNPENPEEMLQATKKGRTVMTFVTVSNSPSKDEIEAITKIWITSLWNNHIQAESYLVDDNKAIFLFKDGAQAWVAKDFLIEQERCESVTIENKVYHGKHATKNKNIEEL